MHQHAFGVRGDRDPLGEFQRSPTSSCTLGEVGGSREEKEKGRVKERKGEVDRESGPNLFSWLHVCTATCNSWGVRRVQRFLDWMDTRTFIMLVASLLFPL